jgi:hypothetical protein
MATITCGWCGIHYREWKNRCDSCGGPMPSLPGMELGPPPPEPPRQLPKGFAFRLLWSGNVLVLVGTIFGGVGAVMFLPILVVFPPAALLPLIFMILGFVLFRIGRRGAKRTLKAFAEGTAVAGELADVSRDQSEATNGQHPWKLTYHFNVDGAVHEGSATSYDSTVGKRAAGQPVWVLYLPKDPAQNTIYPPLR